MIDCADVKVEELIPRPKRVMNLQKKWSLTDDTCRRYAGVFRVVQGLTHGGESMHGTQEPRIGDNDGVEREQ